MRPIIRIDKLSKEYHLGQSRAGPYSTLREKLTDGLRTPMAWLCGKRTPTENTIWALKDIDLEIQPGEVVGIIGHNGAGKSTLLKIISRITAPTTGRIDLYGRVGSLLEVGTGFHPELTGRENVYLSGAILGMSRAEIRRKFDDIIAFAEVERFLDTPVKQYSSGMYMRLAFAVTVHLDSEILVVDEVLAVGDAEFQKRCLRKIHQVGTNGRTILFVSHNMAAMRSTCKICVVLEKGSLEDHGNANEVIDNYQARLGQEEVNQQEVETPGFIVHEVVIKPHVGCVIKTFGSVQIYVRGTAKTRIGDPGLYVGFLTTEHYRLAGLDLKDFGSLEPLSAGQSFELGFSVDKLPLLPGTYELEIHLKDMATGRIEFVPMRYCFEIVETPVYGGRKIDKWFGDVGLKAELLPGSPQ